MTDAPNRSPIQVLFEQRIDGFGTVRIELWHESKLVVCVGGYVVHEQQIKRPPATLRVVERMVEEG